MEEKYVGLTALTSFLNNSKNLFATKSEVSSATTKVKSDLLNGAGAEYDTLKELGDLIDINTDAIDTLESIVDDKADTSDLTSHTSNKSNPHGVTATQLGVVAAGTSLGLVKSGGDVTISSGVITVNDDSHNHTIANVDNLQSSLDVKQATVTGGASTITSSNLTTNRALVSNGSGKVAVSEVTSTELGYLDGVTSNVQTQLDGKAATSHNHAASNITSGTLSSDRLPTVPISKGGTGATTASAVLTNLGITATATELNKLDGVTATTAELNYVDGVTSNIQTQLNGKSSTSHTHNTTYIPDTRNDNQTPIWYITNYPRQVVTEFKYVSVIGLSGTNYCKLTTYVQWNNNSGGYPSQETIINGRLYTRYGTADDTWSAWKTNIDSDNISSQSVATAASCTGNAVTATTASNVAWSGVTSKPSYYDAKAIKSITRNGTTFTYTCMDGTTGTFTQQDNNTDTKVTNTLATTTKAYVTGTTSASTNTGTQVFDTGVYLDTTAGKLTATTFNGTTFSGSGVATVSEVESYLGI